MICTRFNFGASFVYVATGVATLAGRAWAVWLARALATTTLLVFVAFGVHVFRGGAFETRTVLAMLLRTLFWVAQSLIVLVLLRRDASTPARRHAGTPARAS